MFSSISHIALIARDPARTAELFAGVLDAQVVAHPAGDKGHPQSFAKLGGIWFALHQGGARWLRSTSVARSRKTSALRLALYAHNSSR
jgi:catechol 2,3-dioxygenase-like lactoylglutathione lyase family enzyme